MKGQKKKRKKNLGTYLLSASGDLGMVDEASQKADDCDIFFFDKAYNTALLRSHGPVGWRAGSTGRVLYINDMSTYKLYEMDIKSAHNIALDSIMFRKQSKQAKLVDCILDCNSVCRWYELLHFKGIYPAPKRPYSVPLIQKCPLHIHPFAGKGGKE